MKQSLAEALQLYADLVKRYHDTLDLMSARALGDLDRLVDEAIRYGEFLDTLSPAPGSIVDLGSGVGLPGIPIALSLPRSRVTLVERRRRRSTFLRIVVSQLGLSNATVVAGDIRAVESPCADVVVAQAVGTLAQVYGLTRHLHGEQVWLLGRKGASWRSELAQLEAQLGSVAAECHEENLSVHGRLVAVSLPGGSACPPSG